VIIALLTIAIIFAVYFARKSQFGAPPWRIASPPTDGQGGWLRQSILTSRGEGFIFHTPQAYVQTLRALTQVFAKDPDADAGSIDEVIVELQGVQVSFLRNPLRGWGVADSGVVATAEIGDVGTPSKQAPLRSHLCPPCSRVAWAPPTLRQPRHATRHRPRR
jgi:hypothetical protein